MKKDNYLKDRIKDQSKRVNPKPKETFIVERKDRIRNKEGKV